MQIAILCCSLVAERGIPRFSDEQFKHSQDSKAFVRKIATTVPSKLHDQAFLYVGMSRTSHNRLTIQRAMLSMYYCWISVAFSGERMLQSVGL